nr:MAG TPA: hypothetical protein [Caudoviricetes sp.]
MLYGEGRGGGCHTHLSMELPTFLWVKSRCILNDWLLRYEYQQRKEKT